MCMCSKYVSERGEAAMKAVGIWLVPLDEAGGPTPGRIADRLSDIHAEHWKMPSHQVTQRRLMRRWGDWN